LGEIELESADGGEGFADAVAPIGGISLMDAVELGLKVERHKRPKPVFVINHIEEKPTEN
jgi:uncharacterized protein (TIGR03435 family)